MTHEGFHIAELVTGIVLLMLVAAVTTMVSKRIDKLPLTIGLVFVGIGVSYAADVVPGFGALADFSLTPELVLFVFIPTLIFESAFNLNARQVGRNILPILTMAVPGLLVSTAIIGLIMSAYTEFDLMVALLLGAILSATDPVAVIAIFKQLGVPERLTVLVEGESLFNDATSLVLATLLIGIITMGEFNSGVVFSGIGEFFVVFFGGAIVGWLLALGVGYMLGATESDPDIEITLSTILAYFSFVIAEHVFHVSGIMAVVAAGIMMGSWGKSKISPSTEEFMEHFWEHLAYIANVLIFLMVGMQIDLSALWEAIDLIALVFVGMLISRAVVVFGAVPLIGKIPGAEAIGMPYRLVMYWGGLRGAIALAIVLALPNEFAHKDTLVAVVMGAVLFTLVIQGLSIETLVKRLKLNQLSVADQLAKLEGDREARSEGLERMHDLAKGGLFSHRIADNIRGKGLVQIEQMDAEIAELKGQMNQEEMLKSLSLRCLVREKSRYHELFARGLINEWAYRELNHTIDVQMDGARFSGLLPQSNIETSIGKQFSLYFMWVMGYLPGVRRYLEEMRTQWIVRDYGVAWGRHRGAQSVLELLKVTEAEFDANVIERLNGVYQDISSQAKTQIDEVAEQYPEFVESTQEQLGQRLMLITEHDAVQHAKEMGIMQTGIASAIIKEQAERLRLLGQDNMSACFEIEVDELLAKVPLFAEVDASQYQVIAAHLKSRTLPRGTDIIRQGQMGDSMFLIARGIAKVSVREEGESKDIAMLYSGDFFGESALLHDTPRNATATAATPCSLYELTRNDLNEICAAHPEIRQRVERVDAERRKLNDDQPELSC